MKEIPPMPKPTLPTYNFVEETPRDLRWHMGRLQQRWQVRRVVEGLTAETRFEWRDVPTDDGETQ